MSDLPISGLPEATTPIAADLMAIVTDNATIPVTKKITWTNFQKNMKANAITSGLDANKSATPVVGDVYYATDTRKLYNCKIVNVWTLLSVALSSIIVSNNLKWSNDAEKGFMLTLEKKKEIKLNENMAVCRIKFDIKSYSSGVTAYGRVYKNGTAIGTQQSTTSTSYETKSEDFTDFVSDDLIQVYCYASGGASNSYVANFELYFDKCITEFAHYTLTVPLSTTFTFYTNPTNQDPA